MDNICCFIAASIFSHLNIFLLLKIGLLKVTFDFITLSIKAKI